MSSVLTQKQDVRGELIGEVRGKSITTTIKEITPFGVRLSSNGTGQFTGKYTASHMETVNVSLNRDGSSQFETKIVQNTMEGDFVVITARGTGKGAGQATVAFEGEAVFMTQSPKLAWLNTAKGWIEGTTNNATDEYQVQLYAQKQ